jgi:hypothetical protein
MAESVLQQPPVPVPIVAVQGGGGGGGESVLPQPAAGGEVPIIPVQGGGGNEPYLELVSFRTGNLPPPIEKRIKTQNVSSYMIAREKLWGEGKLYKWEKKAFKVIDKGLTEAKGKQRVKELGEDKVFIFYVSSVENLARIKNYINTQTKPEDDYIFILIDDTKTQTAFSDVGKQIIEFIYINMDNKKETEQRDIYFLFDRPRFDFIKTSREHQDTAKLIYLEPTYITIPFKKGTEDWKFIITARNEPPSGITDKYILITSHKDPSIEKLSIGKNEDKVYLNKINQQKFTISVADPITSCIYLEFGEPPANGQNILTATPAAPATPAAGPMVLTATPAAAAAPAAAATPAVTPAKPTVKPYLIQLRPEVTIDIGGNIFTIRKALSSIMEEWKKGNFTYYNPKEATATPTSLARPHLAEKDLFTEIGINEAFLKDVTPRKQELLDRRAGFLQNLVLYQCFNSQNIRYECDMVREFLQDLLELKQIERLSKITRSFITTNVNVELGDSLNKDDTTKPFAVANTIKTVENLLATLFVEVPTAKLRKQGNRPDFSLSGFISPLSGLDSLLSGKKAPLVSTKLPIPTGALNFSSLFASSTPAVAFSPGVAQTRKKFTTLPSFDVSGLFRRKAGGGKNTTRRRRRSAKP